MLDFNTFTLLLIMGSFIILGAVIMHYLSYRSLIDRKKREFKGLARALQKKFDELHKEVADLELEIEEIDEQIKLMQ